MLQYRGKTLVLSQEETKLLLVTDLMRSKPTAAMSEEGAAARGESYMFALEDVAVWALDLAIRGWHGGKTEGIKERDDFKWAPDSSVLRRAARLEMEPLYRLCERLIAARDAKPIAEIETR